MHSPDALNNILIKEIKSFKLVGSNKVVDSNKMLSPSYFIYLTKIFGIVKKTIQPKTLVDSSKRVWLTDKKIWLT